MEFRANRVRPLFVSIAILFAALSEGSAAVNAEDSAEQKIARTQADLKSSDVAVRRSAIGSLVHSDISPKMLAEMRASLDDADGTVRSTAATCIGNLGASAVPAVSQLIAG